MVPFCGRLYFRQYIPGKRFKYGVKMYKLCAEEGYTWSVKVYCGRECAVTDITLTTVLEMMEPVLNSGRTLFTDNFYTSVNLAHSLLEKQTSGGDSACKKKMQS
jgi:hypothetical protein